MSLWVTRVLPLGSDENPSNVNYVVNAVVPMDAKIAADIEERALVEERVPAAE